MLIRATFLCVLLCVRFCMCVCVCVCVRERERERERERDVTEQSYTLKAYTTQCILRSCLGKRVQIFH